MARRELHHTLVAALTGLTPATGTGLVVTQASLDLPLELAVVQRGGAPVLAGSAPHSRWHSGVLPPVHLAHLEIELLEDEPAIPRRRGGQ
jgi:hypothetical protein